MRRLFVGLTVVVLAPREANNAEKWRVDLYRFNCQPDQLCAREQADRASGQV